MNDKVNWTKRYETFLRLAVQTAAAILGLYIMWQAIQQGSDRPYLYTAAIMMIGVPFAHTLESLVGFSSDLGAAFKEIRRRREEAARAESEPIEEKPKSKE